jgi:hypothetical protein
VTRSLSTIAADLTAAARELEGAAYDDTTLEQMQHLRALAVTVDGAAAALAHYLRQLPSPRPSRHAPRGRWPLRVGQRVYVRGEPTIGIVDQVGRVEVAISFPEAFDRRTRIFAWGENIVPVDTIVEQACPELRGRSASEKP